MNNFRPRTLGQKQAMEDTSPNLLCSGPWFSGKTHAGAAKAYIMGSLYRNNCVALVRKKRVDLKATLWKWFVEKALPEQAVVKSNDTDLYRLMNNGTEFWGVGLDSTGDVNKLASREYGFIVVEEAREIHEIDFEEKLIRCLRHPGVPFHQIMMLTNPGAPSHFLYRRFYRQNLDGYTKIEMEMLPDPPVSYQRRLDQLTGLNALRYREGQWVAFEGLVYPFDPDKHIIPRFKIPHDWQRVLAIDFGFDHPLCAGWFAISPSDVWYLYRQMYMTGRTVRRHSEDIKKFCWLDGMEPVAICDHDAEDMATLREEGIGTKPAKKDRLAGQQTMYSKFEHDQFYIMEDSLVELDQKLLMQGRPTCIEDEFPDYRWANNKTREDMVKEKDDGMDMARYAFHTTLSGMYKLDEVLAQTKVETEGKYYERGKAFDAYSESKRELQRARREMAAVRESKRSRR